MLPHRFVPFLVLLSFGVVLAITASPAAAQCELHETQKLVASNGAASDQFGGNVAISGSTLVVGAGYRDCALGADCGSAYVFRLNGVNWVQEAELISSDLAPFDHFGRAVAADGERIVVGAVRYEPNGPISAAAVYVFRFDGTAWVQETKLTAPDTAQSRYFGRSVAVLGDRVFVGAPFGSGGVGSLYIFRRQGTAWMLEANLLPPAPCVDDGFGYAVSVYGDRALVGTPENFCQSNVASPPGGAYVFRREGTNWLQEAQLPRPPGFSTQVLGAAVSLSDNVALVGHLFNDQSAASVYRRAGTLWSYEALLGPLVGGTALLSVATDGNVAVVGGYIPVTHVFIHNGNNWPEVAQLKPTDAPGGSPAVSLSGLHVLFGAPGDDNAGGINAGAAYVFDLPRDCNANGVADDCDITSGTSQDLDGNGFPDECCPLVRSPLSEANGAAKNRYISILPQHAGYQTALRVKLTSLNHPDPPGGSPHRDFSAFEGQTRWVGPPSDFPESSSDLRTFKGAPLQCSPHFMDWGNVGLLHVYGDAIVPSSRFDVQAVFEACSLPMESNYSVPPLQASTARWADVAPPYQQTCADSSCSPCTAEDCVTQPDTLDITSLVNKFKSVVGAPSKVEAQLQPNAPDPLNDLNALDIVVAIDAFKGFGYAYPGPTACPP